MSEEPMIAWSMAGPDASAGPEIAVYPDGRLVLAPRFGGGERRLSKTEIEALEHFVFDDQGLLEIDPEAVDDAVRTAEARRRQQVAGLAVEMVAGATMDASTTMIRASDGERSREITYHDLAADAAAYPEVDALQRLRAVELRLLELADRR